MGYEVTDDENKTWWIIDYPLLHATVPSQTAGPILTLITWHQHYPLRRHITLSDKLSRQHNDDVFGLVQLNLNTAPVQIDEFCNSMQRERSPRRHLFQGPHTTSLLVELAF
ncbi:hypothetical protein M378DRAFT_28258 [Amanita muscaria Koide BX008]|uniref:Uncharacterized protein n=1 Tax=Amanita muscaria (strain Koide BX008) TaxID=946122 RepID=A0A0C2SRJ5_AMAMK|nr:hypothetical protein M378DRAFT_28258 [Amanita muscaria Koide BX008]